MARVSANDRFPYYVIGSDKNTSEILFFKVDSEADEMKFNQGMREKSNNIAFFNEVASATLQRAVPPKEQFLGTLNHSDLPSLIDLHLFKFDEQENKLLPEYSIFSFREKERVALEYAFLGSDFDIKIIDENHISLSLLNNPNQTIFFGKRVEDNTEFISLDEMTFNIGMLKDSVGRMPIIKLNESENLLKLGDFDVVYPQGLDIGLVEKLIDKLEDEIMQRDYLSEKPEAVLFREVLSSPMYSSIQEILPYFGKEDLDNLSIWKECADEKYQTLGADKVYINALLKEVTNLLNDKFLKTSSITARLDDKNDPSHIILVSDEVQREVTNKDSFVQALADIYEKSNEKDMKIIDDFFLKNESRNVTQLSQEVSAKLAERNDVWLNKP